MSCAHRYLPRDRYLELKRTACWQIGVQHREMLLREYMTRAGHRERPFLKDVIDELIEDVQGARLRTGVLPLDIFAQTELVRGRVEVTVNSRLANIPGVKDSAGVAYVAKWHESMHVARDRDALIAPSRQLQPCLPGLEVSVPRRIVCRRTTAAADPQEAEREFIAETAALAAGIAGPDLARCAAFCQFQQLAAGGGELGSSS